jgi:hypothetical protein
MDSIHRLTLILQFGQINWKCKHTWGFKHMVCNHTAVFSSLWDPNVCVPSCLSEVLIPKSKDKIVFSVFDVDKVYKEEEEC